MKHNYSKTLLTVVITVSALLTKAQQTTVVKREWFIQNEKVDTIPITATVLDIAQNIITTGNAIVTGQSTNIMTSKIAPDGTILWQQQINGAANGKDFGTANCIDANGNIYVAGAVYDLTNNFDYLVACYDPNGNLQWQQTFDGAAHSYDVPTAITTDNIGNIYVTGSSLGTTSLTDFVTLQLNASTGQINWVKTYNYANLYEIPVSILKNGNGNIYVTGASASSFNNWDIATIEYDPSGNLVNQDRNTSISNGFDKPADMKRDANGNIYIVGRATTTNSTFDIKLIKLNSSLIVQWVKTFDGQGLNDEASMIEIDYNGNIIIAGYVQKPMDGKEYIIIKYDSNGNLIWQKEKDFSNDNGDNVVKNIALDVSGNIYVTGESKENGETKIVTIKLDENGNEKWSKEFDESGNDEVNSIKVDTEGNIYIVAKTKDEGTNKTINSDENNTLLKYRQFTYPKYDVLDIDGKPIYSSNEFIVRFNSNAVIKSAIDNNGQPQENPFDDYNKFLKPSVAAAFKNVLGVGDNIKLIKVFPYLKTTDTQTLNRRGEIVNVPDFYTSFLCVLPEPVNLPNVLQAVNALTPNVIYAEPNFYIEMLSTNQADTICESNDSYTIYQKSYFHQIGGINLYPAWCIETGKRKVKVGVFDTSIMYRLQDFSTDGTPATTYIKGYDFYLNKKVPDPALLANNPNYGEFHGTAVAGIIGAVRNEQFGLAGIAGGDYSNIDGIVPDSGLSLYSMQIQPISSLNIDSGSMFHIYNAVVSSSLLNSNTPYSFGLHIMNNSWRIHSTQTMFTDTNINLLNDCMHFANRQNVIIAAGRGNEVSNNTSYPALLDSTWILNVAGTGLNGNWDPGNGTYGSSYGRGVDVGAPSTPQLVISTMNDPAIPYWVFDGTSAATPHVSGVAGLMLSHINNDTPSNDNLAPEDVEFVLHKTATDNNTVGYDAYSGYGRLNAGEAMKYIQKPFNHIYHFDSQINSSSHTVTQVQTNQNIYLNWKYKRPLDTIPINRGNYFADKYKVTYTIQHTLPTVDSIKAIFPRHSSSTFFGNTFSDTLLPHERVKLISYSNTTATLEGYSYKIYDSSNNFIGWFPTDTADINQKMSYTIITKDLIASVNEKLNSKFDVTLQPNIGNSFTFLNIESNNNTSNNRVEIYNVYGQLVNTKLYTTGNNIKLDFSDYTKGVYYVKVITSENQTKTVKFIKQ